VMAVARGVPPTDNVNAVAGVARFTSTAKRAGAVAPDPPPQMNCILAASPAAGPSRSIGIVWLDGLTCANAPVAIPNNTATLAATIADRFTLNLLRCVRRLRLASAEPIEAAATQATYQGWARLPRHRAANLACTRKRVGADYFPPGAE